MNYSRSIATCFSLRGRRSWPLWRRLLFPRHRTSVHSVQRTCLRHFFRLKFATIDTSLWERLESHQRPLPCERSALLTELRARD